MPSDFSPSETYYCVYTYGLIHLQLQLQAEALTFMVTVSLCLSPVSLSVTVKVTVLVTLRQVAMRCHLLIAACCGIPSHHQNPISSSRPNAGRTRTIETYFLAYTYGLILSSFSFRRRFDVYDNLVTVSAFSGTRQSTVKVTVLVPGLL